MSFDEARAALADLLEDSVRLRLVSDVPVGTFCSGGVDSSLVTALAARLKGEPSTPSRSDSTRRTTTRARTH